MPIGELVRELRASRGWSQGRLASEINETFGTSLVREYVSGWERGKVRPGPFYLRCLATVLEVPLAVLEGGRAPDEPLTGLSATAVAPTVAADLLRVGFAARLRGGPAVDDWEDRLAVYGTDYMSVGAADLQRRVVEDLFVAQQQLDDPRMWSVTARLMTLYATTLPRSEGPKAIGWFRMAADAADRSEDRGTRVWVRGRAALTLGYGGMSPGLADVLADQAVAIGGRPSAGLLHATMGKAYTAALRGDRAAALRLADRGRTVFDAAATPSEQLSDYALPAWRMNGFLSLLSARLGDEKRASRAQAEARRELPGHLPRFTAHLELHQGLVLTRSGDRAGGLAHAEAALEALPSDKHCGTLQMLMDEIRA
ncbi:helix-turn-helix transcriptional regulator [Streptomyces sp. ISL-11]|uniref:helix-turn-helix domain-containing protein n=1 Tax=Streptomyces sp. ISL-11 TaxID=2819174 RepID=UPI0027E3E61A|nr:helix-turn-helix transcriptional regulator [Streptomyces sp. ISL-11]